MSQYRSHTLLVPALILLRHLDVRVLVVLLPVSLALAYHLAGLFYGSYLV